MQADDHPLDILDRPIWGAEAIAQWAGCSVRATYHLADAGHLDVTKVGARLVSTPRRVLRSLAAMPAV